MNKYIKSIKIGDVELKNNIFLAPMAGITDLPFRHICLKYNPGLMYTEMVSAKGLVYEDIKTNKMLTLLDNERPAAVQIFGSETEDIKGAIEKLNEVPEIAIIDINMGCPAPKVTKNGDGSALLKDLGKIEEILKVAVETSKKPVTVKFRIGYHKQDNIAVELAKLCEKCGVQAITVHGRTKEQMYTGKADLETIKKVKEAVAIPVIGNGDIVDIKSAIHMLEYTGVDGIMIGRGAMGNPWIFKEILDGAKPQISNKERLDIMIEHINMAVDYYSEKRAIPEMRKHIACYLKGLKNSAYVKDLINRETSKEKVESLLREYFESIEI